MDLNLVLGFQGFKNSLYITFALLARFVLCTFGSPRHTCTKNLEASILGITCENFRYSDWGLQNLFFQMFNYFSILAKQGCELLTSVAHWP
jgi:hypothetical protein